MLKLEKKVIVYISSEVLVSIIALLGNALVVLVFIKSQKMRTPTNLYIFSLAIANLITSAVAVPVYLRSMITQRPRDFTACLFINTMVMTFCTVSIFHLIAVSFNRYMAVVWSKRPIYHERGMRRAIVSTIVAWSLGVFIGMMPLMGWNGGKPGKYEVQKCEFMQVMDDSYLMFVFGATVITPSVLLIFFYISIYYAVKKREKRHETVSNRMTRNKIKTSKDAMEDDAEHQTQEPTQTPEEKNMEEMKQIIYSLMLVIIFFHICWYPLHIMNAIVCITKRNMFKRWHFYAPIVLSHASNAINPFIYGLTMPKYKDAFTNALACNESPDDYYDIEISKRKRRADRYAMSKRLFDASVDIR